MRISGIKLAMLAAIAVYAGGTATLAEAKDYYYMYFDQPLMLELDVSAVAVKAVDVDQAALHEALARNGINPEATQPVAVIGWTVYTVDQIASNAGDIEALVATLAKESTVDFASPVFIDDRGLPMLISEYMHIGFARGVDEATGESIAAGLAGGAIEARAFAGLDNVYRVRAASKNGFEVLTMTNGLVELPEVIFAESDFVVRGEQSFIPNDPQFDQQWALSQANDQDVDAPEAWDITTGSGFVEVLIMDMGIQQDHPDLNQVAGQDFTGNNTPGGGPLNDCDNHGTAVAGCVSAYINNNVGIVGLAPACKTRSAKIGVSVDWFGLCFGFFDSQPSMLANALNYAVTTGVLATNSSFGYGQSATIDAAYANARANGVINVAATGNGGNNSISYPSNLPSVWAVGALNSSGNRASFSQYGTGISFSMPGEAVLTTDRTGGDGYENGDYATVDGTSFASPYAAALAALIKSANPALTIQEIEDIIFSTCVDLGSFGYDTTYGWGFGNAYAAVQAAAVNLCPMDFDSNGSVGPGDVGIVKNNFGCDINQPACAEYDLDDNGAVGPGDVGMVKNAFGPCP